MRSLIWGMALGMVLATAQAFEVLMDQTVENNRRCSGMYGKNSWGGPVDPYIEVVFVNDTVKPETDPIVSLLIFEWKDLPLVGIDDPNRPGDKIPELCDDEHIKDGHCDKSDKGEFVVAPAEELKTSKNLVMTKAVHLKNPGAITYAVKKTGYYCILTDTFTGDDYQAVAVFRNAYGELPATQIPKLPFYGGMTLVYALASVFWGFLYFQHRHDILAVQNYITAILVFLVVEMLMTWGFYEYMNNNGSNVGSKVLLVVVAVLNAARNSFSFFLLLIVCMGYGVVKPTLGKTMIYVRWLAVAHFVFGIIYAIASLYIAPETAGPFVLLVVLPLSSTLTAFYVWTLNSLKFTLKDLHDRKQHAKAAMYKKLWWCILGSILVIFGFFFFNSLSFASASDPDYVPFHWKTRWFILDGWLNLVYLFDVCFVAYVWRPTANNRRFAMSDEIAQDDDGTFDLGDIGVPGDSDDEEENIGKPVGGAAAQAAPAAQSQGAASSSSQPLPPTHPQGRSVPRDSLDGETIFAVGDDGDKFTDDESDDEENAKLVRKKD
ncbi:related to PTM1 - member of the major facilitator superfamily [Cephalotrichum gorgonifer]|uniref:Related to PTM1 - member of the major facilitator superfamily n=1 Tax=Cephalotrichum gorgonifer TaxID=2041049 RepID=A0AAE8MUV5_9PEZI|nr:related to PTM1 - member of the major facilitator superfamily [Cephalotrichum gorgonifer]